MHAAHYVTVGRELLAMLDTPRDFEALERLRVETPNLAAALRWLLESDRLSEVLAFFADAGWVDSSLLSFGLDGRARARRRRRPRPPRCRRRARVPRRLVLSCLRAFHVGDWDRVQHLVSATIEADPDSLVMANFRVGEAAMRADLASAIDRSPRRSNKPDELTNPRFLSYMLSLLALVESGLEPVEALRYAEEAVDVARR